MRKGAQFPQMATGPQQSPAQKCNSAITARPVLSIMCHAKITGFRFLSN